MTDQSPTASGSVNARLRVPIDSCSAVTKYRGDVAICDLSLHHPGSHRAILPDTSTYEWVEEPW